MKTYEELECEAYINGYMRLANSYATIIDTQEELSMIDGSKPVIKSKGSK